MNCALKTLIDKREAIIEKVELIKVELGELESNYFNCDYFDIEYIAIAKNYIAKSSIDLLDLRNAIRLIENGAMCNE